MLENENNDLLDELSWGLFNDIQTLIVKFIKGSRTKISTEQITELLRFVTSLIFMKTLTSILTKEIPKSIILEELGNLVDIVYGEGQVINDSLNIFQRNI